MRSGPVEQAPFGAQHGDAVALLVDLLLSEAISSSRRAGLVFHLVDDVSEGDEAKHETDIDETQHFETRELKSTLTCKD